MDKKSFIIAVDFDGTCVSHEYPKVGYDVHGAIDVLQELVKAGHRLILFTMRSGEALEDAKIWFQERGIELWGVNENPEQHAWTESRKVYAQIYIDDAALGCRFSKVNTLKDRTLIGEAYSDGYAAKAYSLNHRNL